MNAKKNVYDTVTLDKFKGALTFSAIGDALGWPTEFGTYPAEVQKRFGKRYLEGFISWQKLVGGRFWGYRETIKEGEYSDDTQLSLAVYRCLDEDGEFNADRFAYFELPLWLHYERGGGRTIKTAARALHQSHKEWAKNFYETKTLSYRNAGANGAAMRVLPIALANVRNERRLYRDTLINSIITHGHPRAILGSIIYAAMVNFVMTERTLSRKSFLDYLRYTVNTFSESFRDDDFIEDWVREWDKQPVRGIPLKETFKRTREEVLECISAIDKRIDMDDEKFYRLTGALSKKFKGSGVSTVLVAMYLFVKYLDDPLKPLLRAVNMLGSDSDTIAAFVGGLFGAYGGLSAIPPSLLEGLQDREYILKSATYLYEIATGQKVRQYVSSKAFDRYDAYLRIIAWELGLREMFWDALKEGETISHPALGRGVIVRKRVESLRRQDYLVKLIEISFDCGQSCVFHSRISKDGELSESLAKATNKMLDSLQKQRAARRLSPST